MDVEWLILADAAQVTGGKLYLIGGGWDKVTANKFPHPQSMSIAVSFRVPWTETNERHSFEVEIAGADGEAIAKVTAESGLTRLSSAAAPDRVRAAARGEADDGQPAARPVRHRAPVEKVASVPSPAPATHSGRVAR